MEVAGIKPRAAQSWFNHANHLTTIGSKPYLLQSPVPIDFCMSYFKMKKTRTGYLEPKYFVLAIVISAMRKKNCNSSRDLIRDTQARECDREWKR